MPRLLGITFLTAGTLHFLRPRMYEAIMPRYLPAHRELVYASGVAEVVRGAGELHARARRPRRRGQAAREGAAPRGLVADRDAARDLPRQRRGGRARRALPAHPRAAVVGA